MDHVIHEIPPLYDEHSRILILGSFPSVKSREAQFFYGHPQNRYWKVISVLLGQPVPQTIEEKRKLVLDGHIAMWDVIASCDIEGSSDSSIKNVVVNDFSRILETADIRQIFCNGGKSYSLYHKYCEPVTRRKAIQLSSSSPANAGTNLEKLIEKWKVILPYLEE